MSGREPEEAEGDPVNERLNTSKAQIVLMRETAMVKTSIFIVQRNLRKREVIFSVQSTELYSLQIRFLSKLDNKVKQSCKVKKTSRVSKRQHTGDNGM
jgi:hypothetical protein